MDKQPESIQLNRLKFYPIMMFAIVMGISGLTIAYQKASELLGFPSIVGDFMMHIALVLFCIISIFYIAKIVKYPKIVLKEWNHPVRINFFSAVSISMLMLNIITKHDYSMLSTVFWYAGASMHMFMTLYTISFWINHNQEVDNSNPAWFIPVVGNVLVPVGGIGLASHAILMYFFSIGVFFWVVLLAIILNRIIFHNQMAAKFMPTLFILLAPPAVAFLAYFKLYGQIDMFAYFLYSIALFFTFILAFMFKRFLGLRYFISWWAFIFPLAAMSIASMVMYYETKELFPMYMSYIMLLVTTLMTALVLYQTIKHMLKKEICIQE
ncbi:MAG: C4-dicarboxylate ABC transporter [Sulfurovum sp.]|nr:C4-dicarboxylate ABC transporter [Sulfurovum sp.]